MMTKLGAVGVFEAGTGAVICAGELRAKPDTHAAQEAAARRVEAIRGAKEQSEGAFMNRCRGVSGGSGRRD